MKPKILLSIMALVAMAFSACQKQETPQTPESVAVITVPQANGETYESGTRAVTIAATADWSAVTSDTWLSVSPSSGAKGMQEVIITFEENDTGSNRTGTVTFSSGSHSESFVLVQNKR